MARIISMLLALAAIWLTVEVYNEGLSGAFSGQFARFGADESEEVSPGSAPQRAGRAVEAAHAQAMARREKLLRE